MSIDFFGEKKEDCSSRLRPLSRWNKRAASKRFTGIIATILVIGLLILTGPANAFDLSLGTPSDSNPIQGDVIFFTANIEIDSTERVPVQNLSLNFSDGKVCYFNLQGDALTPDCEGLTITPIISPFDYGYGYNVFNYTGYGYGYDYGYGYGYGYAGTGTGTLSFNITLNTSEFDVGTLNFTLSAHLTDDTFISAQESIDIGSADATNPQFNFVWWDTLDWNETTQEGTPVRLPDYHNLTTETDIFVSPMEPDLLFAVNVTDDANGTGINQVFANLSAFDDFPSKGNCTGLLELFLNGATGLYEGSCTLAAFDSETISDYLDGSGQVASFNVYFSATDNNDNTAYTMYNTSDDSTPATPCLVEDTDNCMPVLTMFNLHDMGVLDMGQDYVRFGSQTTNMSQVPDFNNVNLILEIEINLSGYSGNPAYPTDFKRMILFNFTSLDFSSPAMGQKLSQLPNALSFEILPPQTFGTSRVYINTSFFAELDSNTTIIISHLPFTTEPNIIADGDAAGVFSQSWATNGFETDFGAITGNLTFRVLGFSGYDIIDNVVPIVDITYPTNGTTLNNNPLTINVTANGTGSEISNVIIILNSTLNNQQASWSAEDFNCLAASFGSEVYTCSYTTGIPNDAAYNITAIAFDYGGDDPGNNASDEITTTIDITAPTVLSVTTNKADGAYKSGASIGLRVTYSEAVTVTGTPTLALNSGATVNYASGSGTTNLTFNYTVAGGQNSADLDYVATTSLSLAGGTIKDAAGNNANNTLPAVGTFAAAHNIVIDTTVPTITRSGVSPVTVELGSSYTDAGASASDNYGGDITEDIVTVNPVNVSAVGTYTVTYNVQDAAGNSATQVTRTVNVADTTNPVVVITNPVNATFNPAFYNFTITDLSSMNNCWYVLGSGGSAVIPSCSLFGLEVLPEGLNNITIYANDTSGNIGSSIARFIIDTAAPTITPLSPANGNTTTNTAPAFIFNVTDAPATNTSCTLFLNGVGYGTNSTVHDSTPTTITANHTLVQGTYLWSVNCTDAANNLGAMAPPRTIYIDTAAPTITLTNSSFNTSDNTPTIYFNYSDLISATANCTAYFNGVSAATNATTLNGTQTALTASTQTDGAYSVYVNCTDLSGFKGQSNSINIIIDTTQPIVVSISSPAAGATVYDNTTDITFIVTDNIFNLVNCTLFVNGSARGTDASTQNNTATTITINPSIAQGAYTIQVNCTDPVGNLGASASQSLSIDRTPPVITDISYEGEDSSSTTGTLKVYATTDENATCWYSTVNFTAVNRTIATEFDVTGTTSHRFDIAYDASETLGPYYISCMDNYTNNMTTSNSTGTIDVTVTARRSSGGGGGGSETSNPTAGGVWSSVTAGMQSQFNIKSDEFGIKGIDFTAGADSQNAKIDIELMQNIGDANIQLGGLGLVYKYLKITATNLVFDGTIKIKFQVPKSWLTANGLTAQDIALNRYVDGKWVSLPTTILSTDGDYVTFESESPGLSYFAIGQKIAITATETPAEEPTSTTTPAETTTTEEQGQTSGEENKENTTTTEETATKATGTSNALRNILVAAVIIIIVAGIVLIILGSKKRARPVSGTNYEKEFQELEKEYRKEKESP